jgi:hypothetical protein
VTNSDDDRIAYLAGDAAGALPVGERAELDELRELLSAPETWDEPDPGLEQRVVAAIVAEAQARPRPADAKPRTRGARWRLTLRRPVFAFGAAAAAVAAAAIVIAVGVGGGSPAPLRFAMVVSGTPLAPNAHGNATLTKTDSGWRIELKATGLPHLAGASSYYQAWLKNPAGVLVPVGTFNDGRNVTLWSGVPVTKFRAFTVTVQQANGNPVSSGRRVLTGTAHPVG